MIDLFGGEPPMNGGRMKTGLDHLEGRFGIFMLMGLFLLLWPVFLVAEVMSWFERRK